MSYVTRFHRTLQSLILGYFRNSDDKSPQLPYFLYRNARGEIAYHWLRLIASQSIGFAAILLGVSAGRYFSGKPFHVLNLVQWTLLFAFSTILSSRLIKRRAEGTAKWQWSLFDMLMVVTVVCILHTVSVLERRMDLQRNARRAQFEMALTEVVGVGMAAVGRKSTVHVMRTSFDDNDLRRLVEILLQYEDVRAPLNFIDLSGTAISDAGVAELRRFPSLEYCFLLNTRITDSSIDALGELPNLKRLGVNGTVVTRQRLLRLSQDRPELLIQPDEYRKPVSR